jgi:flagellar protein FliT
MTSSPYVLSQNQLVEQVYALSEAIEQATRLFDWHKAAWLSRVRSPLLTSIRAEQEPGALAMIREIQAINLTIVQRTHCRQIELAAQSGCSD